MTTSNHNREGRYLIKAKTEPAKAENISTAMWTISRLSQLLEDVAHVEWKCVD